MEKDKSTDEIGFGTKNYATNSRYINNDGSVNVRRKGRKFWQNFDGYHALITMPRTKFLILVILGFLLINLLFASLYYWIGIDHFGNVQTSTPFNDFMQLFFFSAQTLTTVGYGHIFPKGNIAGALATVEAALGLMGFALATGILYARFSRPRSFLLYSRNVLISPYKTLKGLMFRITNPKQNELIEAEAQVILSMIDWESGKRVFIPLDLELRKISFLALTWTIVHPIHSESPLFGFSLEDYEKNDVEIMVFIKSINDTYEQTVHSRHSYTYKDLIMDAKFEPILPRINRKGKMELNVDEINDFQKVEK